MKTWAAFALLLVVGGVPVAAQPEATAQDEWASLELLEIEQDVDRTLLREAMLLLGRSAMKPSADRAESEEVRRREMMDVDALKHFIAEKKRAVAERSVELRKNGLESDKLRTRPPAASPSRPITPRDDRDKQGLNERLEEAQLEVQLLQAEVPLYQQPITEALQALAAAEFAASNDEAQRDKAEAARKRFEKAKARWVEVGRKLRAEGDNVAELVRRLNPGME